MIRAKIRKERMLDRIELRGVFSVTLRSMPIWGGIVCMDSRREVRMSCSNQGTDLFTTDELDQGVRILLAPDRGACSGSED